MQDEKYYPPCSKCGGRCCNYVAIEIDKPATKSGIDHIRWYLLHKDVNIFMDHWKKWFIEFNSPCECLGEEGRCRYYDNRPRICRQHGKEHGDCEFFNSPFALYFRTIKEFERYLKNKKIDWKFRRL